MSPGGIAGLLKDYAGAVIAGVHEGNWYGTDEGARAARDRVLAEVDKLRAELSALARERDEARAALTEIADRKMDRSEWSEDVLREVRFIARRALASPSLPDKEGT